MFEFSHPFLQTFRLDYLSGTCTTAQSLILSFRRYNSRFKRFNHRCELIFCPARSNVLRTIDIPRLDVKQYGAAAMLDIVQILLVAFVWLGTFGRKNLIDRWHRAVAVTRIIRRDYMVRVDLATSIRMKSYLGNWSSNCRICESTSAKREGQAVRRSVCRDCRASGNRCS